MKDTEYSDVVIIGGGASGLAAAVELGMISPGLDVTVIEKNSEPGRKIRATGSGRCNISNTEAEGYAEIQGFFDRIGLMTRTYENGLVYPYSESAADVAELLETRARELGVRIISDAEVTGVRTIVSTGDKPDADRSHGSREPLFETEYDVRTGEKGRMVRRVIRSSHVILACGGKAGPTFGTTGDGYRLARQLGHSIVTPVPVLTSIECREWEKGSEPAGIELAGTRTRGMVALYRAGRGQDTMINEIGALTDKIFEEAGEIQFTRYGLSGICVFNMTRHMRYDRQNGGSVGDFRVLVDLFPDGDIRTFLRDRRACAFPGEQAGSVLRTVLKDNIARYVIERASVEKAMSETVPDRHDDAGSALAKRPLENLSDSDIEAIGRAVHSLIFHPTGIKGWKDAQATSGGVSLAEIDEHTGESLLVPGLYITGELADRDYPCGGFNLSNAWLTGMQAARAISECCRSEQRDQN